jgi:hypothetical protein
MALFQGGEIEVWEADRSLDLPSIIASKEDQIGMGLQPFDWTAARVGRRVREEGNNLFLPDAHVWPV